MSDVSNLMISIGYLEDPEIAEGLFRWIELEMPLKNGATGPERQSFASKPLFISGVDSQWGGAKSPEVKLYATSLNHADVFSVVDQCAKLPWQDLEGFQLFIKDQDDARFRIWQFRGDVLVELA